MSNQRIVEASVTHIPVFHRKEVGKAAARDNVGYSRSEWLVRVRTDGGLEGLTVANRYMSADGGSVAGLLEVLRRTLLGRHLDELLVVEGGRAAIHPSALAGLSTHRWLSTSVFDLVARSMDRPCIDLLGGRKRDRVPAYDTTMFYQDFLDPEKGPAKSAEEAAASKEAGYRQMKVKVGRGGRWMLPEQGLRRDIEVVQAIREAVGPDFTLMVDANFGYTRRMDLLEVFFRETSEARLFWFEEMIEPSLEGYRELRTMQEHWAPEALLVCGEVDREPIGQVYRDLAEDGLIDGYQADIGAEGFASWMEIERQLAGTGVRSVPRNFGNGRFGTRAGVTFGAASESFLKFEDERQLDHVYKPDGFVFEDGEYVVPYVAGLGLEVDEDVFQRDHGKHEILVKA